MSNKSPKPHYRGNPAMFRDAPLRFMFYILLIPVFGIGLGLLLTWYIARKSVRLEISPQSVTLMTGFFSKSFVEIPLDDVAAIKVYQTWFQRLMGVGKISISSTGKEGYQIEVSALSDPFTAQRCINHCRGKLSDDKLPAKSDSS